MPEWFAQTVRVTLFPAQPLDLSTNFANWWEAVVGSPPEAENRQPRVGVVDISGPLDDAQLTLHVEPIRVDWSWQSLPLGGVDADSPKVMNLGPAEVRADALVSKLMSWGNSFAAVHRLAFGMTAVSPVESREVGYRGVEKLLRGWVHLDPARNFDFNYQVNWPVKNSAINGARVNRLCRWSVGGQTMFRAHLTFERGRETSATHRLTEPAYYLRQDLDINTHGSLAIPLEGEHIGSAISELKRIGLEYLATGVEPYDPQPTA